jgi:hypothetical protein
MAPERSFSLKQVCAQVVGVRRRALCHYYLMVQISLPASYDAVKNRCNVLSTMFLQATELERISSNSKVHSRGHDIY